MKRLLLCVVLLAAAPHGLAAESQAARPFEAPPGTVPATPLDALVRAAQEERDIEAANPCSDAVFIRRVYLDVIGTLPEPADVRTFLRSERPGKRAALVDALLEREEFADYWSLKWCDLLRVKAEFPINLWPNAVQAYHKWVRDAVRENLPYDRFARALLTSSGSNFRVPPVNFYRAVQGREPGDLAAAAALTFMGTRTEGWTEERRDHLAVFFSRVAFKRTKEWKEEIVLLDPAPAPALDAILPDGTAVHIAAHDDPREAFADWLVSADNPWFARAVANRVWSWLLGRGVVHETDDFRADNPPAIPGLLEYLAEELVAANWDLRHVFRLVLNSRTYQQSPVPRSDHPDAEALFASYPVRRLDAEVLIDALGWLSGTGERYSSAIPEPYTFVPEERRTIALADGSITSPFLELFGRPPRDTGQESERSTAPSSDQSLHLLNSTDVLRRIQTSPRLRQVFRNSRRRLGVAIRETYLTLLCRYPVEAEVEAATRHFQVEGRDPRESACDLAWALVNSREFLYRH